MIIFYNKKSGKIAGTIDGRVHKPSHFKMWVGGKENNRIIVEWEPVGGEFQPKVQKDIFTAIDKDRKELKKYKVDVKTKKLVLSK